MIRFTTVGLQAPPRREGTRSAVSWKGRAGRLPKNHLCTRGFGRCGLCMEALLPRTDGGRETYICRSRKTWGTCDLPVLDRAAVDETLLRLFEERALDYEQTRDHLAAQLSERSGEALAQAARAGREAAEARAARDRIDREYLAGELGGANYERLGASLDGDLAAAEAEAERLAAHAADLTASAGNLDAESETLKRLAELRSAVAGRVNGARDIPAVRAALAAVFEFVAVIPESEINGIADPEPDLSRLALVPAARAEVIVDLAEREPYSDVGDLRCVPVGLSSDANKTSGSGVPE